jgi:hypothetical protein
MVRVHRMFVADTKEAFRQAHGSLPKPADISPQMFGKQPLVFGFRRGWKRSWATGGDLRFVEFSFSPRTGEFGCSDGGDRLAADGKLWLDFAKHPLVARELGEKRYPTLYGIFAPEAKRKACRKSNPLAAHPDGEHHCLMLDRREQLAYVFTWFEAILFFPLTEPEEGDDHIAFNGKLVSSGCEVKGRVPSIEAVANLRNWLNAALFVRCSRQAAAHI